MQLEKLQDQKPECHLEWPYEQYSLSVYVIQDIIRVLMGNITGILSNNFAHAQAVSSRPNCLQGFAEFLQHELLIGLHMRRDLPLISPQTIS